MPELPEVHTTVSQLQKEVVQKTITDAWSDYHENSTPKKGQIKDPSYYGRFVSLVSGSTITEVSRRGKNILIHLNNGQTVLIHMKMTGHLLYGTYKKASHGTRGAISVPEKWENEQWIPVADENSPLWDPFNRYIHLVFTFSDPSSSSEQATHLVLSDMRKFAKVTLLDSTDPKETTDISQLGENPLSLSPTQFQQALRGRRSGKIKTVLMDQSVIAGVGNIYSDEALFEAKIHPETDVQDLSDKQINLLKKSLEKVLTKAIKMHGDSDSDYRNLYGEKGGYQNAHQVYRRTGKACPRRDYSDTIKRITVGGRSAHFCPTCQKKE